MNQKNLEFLGKQLSLVKLETLPVLEKAEHRICLTDEYNYEIVDNMLQVYYTRRVRFNPEEIFSLEVAFVVNWKFDLESTDEIKNKLSASSTSDIEYLIENSAAEASLIIAQLSNAMDGNPLITPPIYSPASSSD